MRCNVSLHKYVLGPAAHEAAQVETLAWLEKHYSFAP